MPPGFHLPHVLAVQAACNIELYRGEAKAAARRLAAAWPEIDRVGALRLQQLRVELELLRARVALADPSRSIDERAKIARAIADDLMKEGVSWATGLGLLVRASVPLSDPERKGQARIYQDGHGSHALVKLGTQRLLVSWFPGLRHALP